MDLGSLQCWSATSISTLVDPPTLLWTHPLPYGLPLPNMPGTPRSGYSEFAQFIDL